MLSFGTLAQRGNTNRQLSEKWLATLATLSGTTIVIPFVTPERLHRPAENIICAQE